MKKTFVLDTNVLLHNASCIESFADNHVLLPMAVIEELDKFKGQNNELGRNARQVIRRLDELRGAGNLRDGVPLVGGGSIQILSGKFHPGGAEFDVDSPDNRILYLAFDLHKQGQQVIFISKDINARLKADALGLQAADFMKEQVNFDDLYAGYRDVTVSKRTIEAFYATRTYENRRLGKFPNEFLLLKERGKAKKTALALTVKPGVIRHLSSHYDKVWNLQARNKEQRMALELLMDPQVSIVTLVGQAGTGKTLLALAAALHSCVKNKTYDRILVSRPVIPMGKDIGYLPGAKEEKISHWMQPIFDNLTYLLRDGGTDLTKTRKKTRLSPRDMVEKLIRDNVLELEALTYIRGRSIPRQFVLIDEAQNLTPHEVKTIVSRAGDGTKIVLTGDPYQIDNPYLDASSNGLTYAAERLKEQTVHGHTTLKRSERSALAAIAAHYL